MPKKIYNSRQQLFPLPRISQYAVRVGREICPEDLYLYILYVTIDSDTEPNQVPAIPRKQLRIG
jgi:hypothetical protein